MFKYFGDTLASKQITQEDAAAWLRAKSNETRHKSLQDMVLCIRQNQVADSELLLEIRDLLKQLAEQKNIDTKNKEFECMAKYAPRESFDKYFVDLIMAQLEKRDEK